MSEQRRIIIIGGGVLTVPAIQIAQDMGLIAIVFDGNPDAPGMALANIAVTVSTKDPAAAVKCALELNAHQPIAGVVTAGADVEVTVAAITAALGLPGVSPETAHLCNHKGAMRRLFADLGIAGPRFCEVASVAEGEAQAPRVGFPLIVKPIDNCGSRGVVRVDCQDDIGDAVNKALALSRAGTVLLEEYIEATTHTVEMIAYDGEFFLGSIIDTHHGFAPYAVELRNVNPSERSEVDQRAMHDLAVRAARAVGITEGPAKVDILFADDGPKVMEMCARLSGGFHCQYTTPLALGTNNIRAAIHVALGEAPRRQDLVPRTKNYAACEALFPAPGRVMSVDGLERARSIPGVAEVFVFAKPGDTIPEYCSSADRRAYVIASGGTRAERNEAIRCARATISIKTMAA